MKKEEVRLTGVFIEKELAKKFRIYRAIKGLTIREVIVRHLKEITKDIK